MFPYSNKKRSSTRQSNITIVIIELASCFHCNLQDTCANNCPNQGRDPCYLGSAGGDRIITWQKLGHPPAHDIVGAGHDLHV